ncbi:MAG TPA: glycosyltransferase family 4 protein [Thermoanaerobaculia bacterium]|jgi:glycosyltransferase involved in cell wall biosynthesis|nr:glycosyltransferase family 4 protein [Thermoanaerobaculia bacterium]
MNILVLCTDAFGGHGGIALFNRDLTEALAQMPERGEIVVLPRVIRNAVAGVPEGVTFVEAAARGQFAYARELTRVKRRMRFDLVICSHMNLLPLARIAANDPLLVTYGIEAWRPRRRSSNALLHHCRGIVAISEITRSRLVSWSKYAGPTFILPNAVRPDQYGIRPKRRDLVERYKLEGKRVVMTLGRIDWSERYKGFDEILEILAQLPEDVVYLIAGGGSDVQRIQKKAMACGVGDRVRFTGIFADEEKADLYNLADVYAMPSRGEGFGFVILEAMASGVPVIVSKHDGGREAVLNGKLGTLVDPSNPAEIRTAIADALELGERKIPEGLDYFGIDRFNDRVHAIVRSFVQ